MKTDRLRTLACGLALAVLTLTSALPAAAEQCVRFDGIDHCAAGAADLNLSPNGARLIVSNLGPAGDDGVVSIFDNATKWSAQMAVVGQHPGDEMTFNAISNGLIVSKATFNLEPGGNMISNGFFTAGAMTPTFDLVVIDNGYVVDVFEGMSSGSSFSVVAGPGDTGGLPGGNNGPFLPPWDPWPWPEPWPPEPTFGVGSLGNCFWSFAFAGSVVVETTEGSAMGNEIRMIENMQYKGAYAYNGFDGIETLSNGSKLVIGQETVNY